MRNKKRVVLLLIILALSFTMISCSLPIENTSIDNTIGSSSDIASNSYNKVTSKNEILALLLKTMQDNLDKCYFNVSTSSLIDADSWLNELNGIEEINCEYKRVKNGYNVVVSLSYWDNYSIVNAYQTDNTNLLTPKQLELYNRYLEVLSTYTSPDATQWANELAIHDYLVANIQYVTGDDSIYNAYDALMNGTAVCNGYTECFKTFMDMLGIECTAISGSAGNELHVWNLVRLDGQWYQVDVTWDDPINGDGKIEHAYFNITSETMAKDHSWNTALYVQADGMVYSYPNIMKLPSFSNNKELVSFLKKQLVNHTEDIEYISTYAYDLKPLIEQCGISVKYTYKIFESTGYSLYQLSFDYE